MKLRLSSQTLAQHYIKDLKVRKNMKLRLSSQTLAQHYIKT